MSTNETDAVVARVERIVAIAERQVGCIPEMFHLADADDGRLLQECSAEYPHQCFDEPGHHALTLADLRAVLAQLEAAKADVARIDWLGKVDAPWLNYQHIDYFGGWIAVDLDENEPLASGTPDIRAAIDKAREFVTSRPQVRPPSGAPENG